MQISDGGKFLAEETATAKALGQENDCCIQGKAGKPVCLGQKKRRGEWEETPAR